MKRLGLLFSLVLTVIVSGYEGYWMMPDGKFIIHITKSGDGVYSGNVAWLLNPTYPEGDKDEGKIQVDRNNSDEKLRGRHVMGLKIVGDLVEDEDGELVNGWVYDSWNGNMYHGKASLIDDNTLKLRGSFDKFGILGLNQEAKRVEDLSKYGIKD